MTPYYPGLKPEATELSHLWCLGKDSISVIFQSFNFRIPSFVISAKTFASMVVEKAMFSMIPMRFKRIFHAVKKSVSSFPQLHSFSKLRFSVEGKILIDLFNTNRNP